MTLNIAQLRERVATRFSDVEQLDESTLRYIRKAGDRPFAVYYLDIAEDLPRTQETLTKYQDRVIGSHYFEGKKSLQWSNYLYFITSRDRFASSEVRQAKELIERDRSYARKFVIPEEELDAVLTPPVVAPAATAVLHASVLSVWTERLVAAGLDAAILSDDDLPTRLKLIEDSSTRPIPAPKQRRRNALVNPEPFIRSLHLKEFRDYPRQRSFDFRTVNLIFGANGSGKTSLLEAIELFYCGRNKRNPSASPRYDLTAVFANGRSVNGTGTRPLQTFRNRNLAWYGQPEVKTSNLYQSFGQFNFLDTDAAVSLADSASRIEDDLSNLLVGPDASKTWRNIERVYEAVSLKLRDLRPLEAQTKEDLATLEKSLKEAGATPKESDSIGARLDKMIHRLGWSSTQDDKQALAGMLVEELSELVSLAQQGVAFDWTESPVSINGLTKYCHTAKLTSDKAETDIARLELQKSSQKLLADATERDREAKNLAEQARPLIDAGVAIRAAELSKQQTNVATYSSWLVGLDADALAVVSTADLDMTVAVCHAAAVSKRSVAEALLANSSTEYATFSKLRDQSLNLAQQLRQIAARILQGGSKPDECPLCHTLFAPGELAQHIDAGVDQHLEAAGQALLNQLRQREAAVRDAAAVEATAACLRKFSERANIGSEISVRSVLTEVENAKQALAQAQSRRRALNAEVLALESQGLSLTKLEQIAAQLQPLGYSLAEFSGEVVDRLLFAIDRNLVTSSRTLETESKQTAELQQMLEANLGSAASGVQDLKSALSQLRERLATTESLLARLREFSFSFPWAAERSIAELAVEAESIRNVAAELQAAIGRETQAKAAYTESTTRKIRLERELADLRPRLNRLADAYSALEQLQNEHSLRSAMESALQQNRDAVEKIFSRIHSPAEFQGLGSNWTTLIRKADGSNASLKEISTGQRAAFALSIFLAQNAQLSVAPPVVLIDDPIAHVDDLNSLSFLDYVREVVLTDRRQIYFATANAKLATLFERKFDFLGEEGFRRFDLWREAPPLSSSE